MDVDLFACRDDHRAPGVPHLNQSLGGRSERQTCSQCLLFVAEAWLVGLLVRRVRVERIVLAAVRDRLANPENLDYVFKKLEQEVASASTATPETIRLKEVECDAEQRRVANFIEFVAEGRGSRALGSALTASETRLKELRIDLEGLRRSQDEVFLAPPREWITERIGTIQTVLERRTERSALLLRKLLGVIRMEPVKPDIGRPYYRALSDLDALAIVENDPDSAEQVHALNPQIKS